MKVIDAHCDFLSKLAADPNKVSFEISTPYSDVSLPRLRAGHVAVQIFALFLNDRQRMPVFADLLEMFDHGDRQVLSREDVRLIKWREDLDGCGGQGPLGALLSLEGVDALEGNLAHLRTAYRLGLRALGLTWNHANWAADGVMEPRQGGLTLKGKQLVRECAGLGIMLDASHLTERGFWELAELFPNPFHASHSNAKAICPHPRNLTDAQIRLLIERQGMIGITFVPYFVKPNHAQMKDLLLHIDHIGALGGEACIGFGSDFDGIEQWIPGLEHPDQYGALAELLGNHYSEQQVAGFLHGNWLRYLKTNLPACPSSYSS